VLAGYLHQSLLESYEPQPCEGGSNAADQLFSLTHQNYVARLTGDSAARPPEHGLTRISARGHLLSGRTRMGALLP
jgi:hypothetical protein